MSEKTDLELDAILAEFHAEETGAPVRPVSMPSDRPRRRAEVQGQEPAPAQEPAPVPQREVSQPRTAVAVAERPPVVRESRPDPREGRAVRRRRAGLTRMLLTLAALAILLVGLLVWAIGDEKQDVVEETEVIRMDLGEDLEDYLDDASTRSH